MRLPRSLDDLRGLRAARWVRESTERQADRYGPEAQRYQQDRAIERYGLTDTGIGWNVHHSGRTIAATGQWSEMLAGAGRAYDVLVVGYVSRFARDLRTAVNARHDFHAAGAAILFADERVLTSDEDAWETWAREAVEAEAYSRRLGRRIREGYEAKFRRLADQGGAAPLGFRRQSGVLAVDPHGMATALRVFELYASGTKSHTDIERLTGIEAQAVREMLRNPVYNGWVRRHRRGHDEERRPAAWRDDPPISDDLWARVQQIRERRYNGGGHPKPRHTHLLARRMTCVCGTRLRAEGTARGTRRYRHPNRCSSWEQSTRVAGYFEEPIAAQVAAARPTPRWLVQLRALAAVGRPDSTALRRRQLEHELSDRALAHARRSLSTDAYLAEHARIAVAIAALDDAPKGGLDPDAAVRFLQDIARSWRLASEEARRDVVAAIYDRIVVDGERIVSVELTPEAQAHGLVLALPEVVMARRAGFEPAT